LLRFARNDEVGFQLTSSASHRRCTARRRRSPDERNDPRQQADHQQRAKHQFERAGRRDQRRDVGEIGQYRKLEDLGDAVLKQQKPGDEAKQTQRRRLPFREHLVELVHIVVPLVWYTRNLASQHYTVLADRV